MINDEKVKKRHELNNKIHYIKLKREMNELGISMTNSGKEFDAMILDEDNEWHEQSVMAPDHKHAAERALEIIESNWAEYGSINRPYKVLVKLKSEDSWDQFEVSGEAVILYFAKPTKYDRMMSPEGMALKREFDEMHDDAACSCHMHPPCPVCTHPGNPVNLQENPDAWLKLKINE